jgi:hypothetical protein
LWGHFSKGFCKLKITPKSADMERTYKNCQSCGMPMKRDEHGGGTNADGSKNTMYCSHCFQDGKFTVRNITVDDMKERVRGKLKQVGFPGFVASLFTRNIHKLERWRIDVMAVE